MIKTFRYRLYPTKRQEELLNNQLAICCELYNAALQERRDAWKAQRKRITWFDQNLQLTHIRKIREDVAALNANALEDVLKRVHLAYAGFFSRLKRGGKAGYPRFRSVARYDSITYRQRLKTVLHEGRLRLHGLGHVRIKVHRPVEGEIKILTVKREAGRWFALFAVDCESTPLPFNPNMIGIDVGINHFATLSNGTKIENPRWFRSAQAKLRRLQRRVARRKRGSHRRRKAVLLLQRFHNHIRDQRRDFHHKESRKLVNRYGLIAVEDLNVKGLARGWLGKSMLDVAVAAFINMLTYKAEDAGGLVVKVDPRGTSQTCICGAEVRKTLAMRVHHCWSCGRIVDRDHMSALVILGRVVPSGVNVGDLMPCVA